MQDPNEHPPLPIVGAVRAPDALRARIEADRERLAPRRALRRRLRMTAALACVAAVAGGVVAALAPSGAPTVLEAAALASRPVASQAPEPDPRRPQTLRASVGGVRFPTWGERHHWTASGRRGDELEGRRAVTVFYDNRRGGRLGYTIVAGEALEWPDGARHVRRRGVEVALLRHGDRRVATWRVGGHTCVISAPASVSGERLVELASRAKYG